MRGFPLLRVALVAAALALLAFPVHWLTLDKPAIAAPPEASIPEKTATYHVVLTTSTPASRRSYADWMRSRSWLTSESPWGDST